MDKINNELKIEIQEKLSKAPQWLEENENDIYTISHKDKKYTLKELDGEVVEQCIRISDKTNTPMESLLAAKSSVEPKLSDADLKKLPGSLYFKFKIAITYIYGLSDFL